MPLYRLVRIMSRKNKENKPYYLAYVLYSDDNNCDLLNILITREDADFLIDYVFDENFDIGEFIRIEYNSYQKKYLPKIVLNNN